MKEPIHLNYNGKTSELLTDEDLLREIASGRQEDLKELHYRYAPLILNLAAQSLDRPAAEEIVQDVFVAVWRHAGSFDPQKGAARSWLLRIAHLRVVNELRRRSRRPRSIPDPDGQYLGSLPDAGLAPDEVVLQEYRRSALHAAVSLLPPAQRQALSLAYFEDLTHKQIADYLEVPLGTVKTRIRTAVQTLRVALIPTLVLTIVLAGSLLAAFAARLRHQNAVLERQAHALQVVTSSDVTPLRLIPVAQGLPAGIHASYRSRPDDNVAVMTFTSFPPAPDGRVYQAWILQDDAWRPLATVTPNQSGAAMVIIYDHGSEYKPDGLEVTLEPVEGSTRPAGPVIVAWSP